jgi:P27 family predicted phage terminase small subunit
MMPRTKKAAGMAVDQRNGRRADLAVVVGERFDPPEDLCPEAVQAWDAYWDDRVAQVQTPVDRPILTRWVTEMDRYLRLLAEADKQPLVAGSQGQPVENPLYKIAYQSLAAVQYVEKQMGMGALNRSALGIAVIAERKSLADMNSRYGGTADASPRAAPPDPRKVIDAEA